VKDVRNSELPLLLLLVAAGCATPSTMVPLDGQDPVFAAGRKSFTQSKERCFQAVLATLENTGHGVDKQDPEAGSIVSGMSTVYHGTQAASGSLVERTIMSKFYVNVTGDQNRCEVVVVKLRVWDNNVEVQTRTSKWIEYQLGGFLLGVNQELNEPAGMPKSGGISARGTTPELGPTVTGSIDREVVRSVVRSHLDKLRDCYERQLTANGKLTVQWAIGPQGAVAEARVVQTDTGSAELDTCVVGYVRSWVFPAPRDGGVAVVTYPFVFKRPPE
jgi:TonB family protein